MKRLGIAVLPLPGFCCAHNAGGFEPASTKVWGAAEAPPRYTRL
jgi:hypothetical protein